MSGILQFCVRAFCPRSYDNFRRGHASVPNDVYHTGMVVVLLQSSQDNCFITDGVLTMSESFDGADDGDYSAESYVTN